MKNKDILHLYQTAVIVLLVAVVILAIQFFFSAGYAGSLRDEISYLNGSLTDTQNELEAEKQTSASLREELEATEQLLNDTNASLQECDSELDGKTHELSVCLTRNDELSEFLDVTQEKLELLGTELSSFEEQISQSMSWFKENSNIEVYPASLKYQVDKCTSNTEINAACIPIVMKEEKGWDYKIDEGDDLQSLEEISLNKGGDCEDWSLYFKAAYNYLKEEDRSERYIVSAVPGTGDFEIYGPHYYAEAESKEVGTTEDYVYVICYDSHCIVAISDVEIKNSSDIYKLRGAPAIEPQNGQYMFTIGDPLAPDICSPDTCGDMTYAPYDIWMIITDDDIYDFHYNSAWVGYSDYYRIANYYQERVEAMNSLLEQQAD